VYALVEEETVVPN